MTHRMIDSDTIAALATPNGRGGIAVIKLSGPKALILANSIFRCKKTLADFPRTMLYGHIFDGHDTLDEALICYMPAPHSHTGEDVVEIQSHGGLAVSSTVLTLLTDNGARPAEPGEFTRRAFLNGRIDLVQAESVMEVVSAETREQLRQAERLMDGGLSRYLDTLQARILRAEALLTVNIDFSDQDRDEITLQELRHALLSCREEIDTFLQSTITARRLRDGVTVVLTGAVNSGKSSLFNALLGHKRSLVNARPGTTRDWIEERIDLDGFPVNLIDTAGLRDTDDDIEREGVEESRRILDQADLILHLMDPAHFRDTAPADIPDERILPIFSKSDLVDPRARCAEGIYTSTVTGEGLDECRSRISALSRMISTSPDSHPLLMIERHRAHLEKARLHLSASLEAIGHWSEEIIAFELKQAQDELHRITGHIFDDTMLDFVFRSFCIGK